MIFTGFASYHKDSYDYDEYIDRDTVYSMCEIYLREGMVFLLLTKQFKS